MGNTVIRKIWKIILIIFCIVGATILLSLLQYLLYYRNNPQRLGYEWQGEGRLLFEDGSECSEKVPVKIKGVYFDHGMFYQNKNSVYFDLKFNKKRSYSGYYYMADMSLLASEYTGEGSKAEKNTFHLPYAHYALKESWTFIFSVDDVSDITKSGTKGQKGILIVTNQESQTPAEAIEKALQKSEEVNRQDAAAMWKKYLGQ